MIDLMRIEEWDLTVLVAITQLALVMIRTNNIPLSPSSSHHYSKHDGRI